MAGPLLITSELIRMITSDEDRKTNQIWTQEAGTHDTHNRTLTDIILQKLTSFCTFLLYSLLYLFKVFLFSFSQMPLSHVPPQKLCIKGTEIKNQRSAVIALFEITIIKINYNLRLKRCLINFISILTESLWCQHSFISHSSLDKHVSSVPVTSRQESVTSVIFLINTIFTCWGSCSCVNSLFIQHNTQFTDNTNEQIK